MQIKLTFFIFVLTLSGLAGASPIEQRLTIKERLRISLWKDGLKEESKQVRLAKIRPSDLPEEIERSLRKL